MPTNIVVYYNEHGCRVVAIRPKRTRILYTAGTHRQDAQVTVAPADPGALPLRQIKQFCANTPSEIANETER